MTVTAINDSNIEFFMGAFTKETAEEADLLLGVIDDEDEYKACGGMALDLDDNGFRIISLYIAENKRRLGAATALLKALDDFCEKESIPGIGTSYILNESTEAFEELLRKHNELVSRRDILADLSRNDKLPDTNGMNDEDKKTVRSVDGARDLGLCSFRSEMRIRIYYDTIKQLEEQIKGSIQ